MSLSVLNDARVADVSETLFVFRVEPNISNHMAGTPTIRNEASTLKSATHSPAILENLQPLRRQFQIHWATEILRVVKMGTDGLCVDTASIVRTYAIQWRKGMTLAKIQVSRAAHSSWSFQSFFVIVSRFLSSSSSSSLSSSTANIVSPSSDSRGNVAGFVGTGAGRGDSSLLLFC